MQSFDFRIKVIREYLDQEVLNDDLRKEMNIEFIKKVYLLELWMLCLEMKHH